VGAGESGVRATAVTYRIRLEPAARKGLLRLEKPVRQRIGSHIDALATNPRPVDSEQLTGALRPFRRVRIGDYRVCYHIDDDARIVTVVEIAHRSKAYKTLNRRN